LFTTHPACLAFAKVVGEAINARTYEFDGFDGGDTCETLTRARLSGLIGRFGAKRLDMLLTEPVAAAAALDHQTLIPILMTSRHKTFRGDEQGPRFPHLGASFSPISSLMTTHHSQSIRVPPDTLSMPLWRFAQKRMRIIINWLYS
jgi:hypothetical protein